MTEARNTERVIDVVNIEPRHRHQIIFKLIEHLDPDDSLQLVVDHDPQRLRFLLDFQYGSEYGWTYLQQGPDTWRVRLRRLQAETGLQQTNVG
jgi:uncharacterized protein (DUF2249 family)